MNFMKKTIVYLLLLVFDVKTIVNEVEKFENCVGRIGASIVESNEESSNLLKLIDQSTVILKAFCSENLINVVIDDEDNEEEENARNEEFSELDDGSDIYDVDYDYKTSERQKLKTLMPFAPLTVYKGVNILRQLELFNNQEYFQVKGQLNATLELDKHHRALYQRKCFDSPKINNQDKRLNENHLIERQIRLFVPGQLIMFAKLDKNNFAGKSRLIVKSSGIVKWKPHVENFVWNNLGWSNWSEFTPCSKSCKGIQQRYRQCLTNQQNSSNNINDEKGTKKMDSFMSATIERQQNQHLCNGYNIEQRECNLFECKDAVNILSLTSATRTSVSDIGARINQIVDKNDFTIMLTVRSKVNKHHLRELMNQHLMSLRSDTSKYMSLTISLIDSGIKVVQEKDSASEMFDIKLNLFDSHWHQIAVSFRNDGLITCYVDCIWDSTFVMAKGTFQIPQPRTRLEINSKLNGLIEWKQLSLISGVHERAQCSNERTPIYDNNKFVERMFNDEAN